MQKRTCILTLLLALLFTFSIPAFAANIQYTYDNLNRVTKVDYGNGRAIEYSYDQNGNRTARTVNTAGSISVTISPQGAGDAGAEWKVDSGTWQANKTTASGISVGQHTVSFSDVSGWTKPGNQTVSVTDGQTTPVTGIYVQATKVNGACGSSDGGSFTSAPASNLCSAGTASSVTGTGPWYWTCQGANGGANQSCSANVPAGSGACGSADGRSFLKPPRSNLCSAGKASKVAGKGPWNWTCAGSNGGSTANCSANLVTNGACGSSNGKAYTSAPTLNLCKSGTASSTTGTGPWSWTCEGANGGTNASCSAKIKVNGTCGSANKANFFTQPEVGLLCSSGNASSVTGKGPWKWKCAGSGGGKSTSCSANLEVNGACGGSNGMTLTKAPKSNLCNAGKASKVTGTGPWNWSCAGSNGGTTDSCSANIQ